MTATYSPIFRKFFVIPIGDQVANAKPFGTRGQNSVSDLKVKDAPDVKAEPLNAPLPVLALAPPTVPMKKVSTPTTIPAKEQSSCMCSCFIKCLR